MNEATSNSSLSRLLAISAPTMIINISRSLMQFVDFLIVSSLGTAATAAIAPAGITTWILIGLVMGTVSIVSTFASQSLGKGEPHGGATYLWQSVYLSIAFALLAECIRPAAEPIYAWYGHSPDVMKLELDYTRAVLYSTGPSALAFAAQSYLVGVQRAWYAVIAAVIANIANLIFSYILVFGMYGFPELGIAGAGFGTVIATIIQAAICFYYLCKKDMRVEFGTLRNKRFSFEKTRRLLKLGFPAGLTWIVDIICWAIFAALLVGGFGTAELAASNICLQFTQLSFMPALGIGQAVTALVGESIGRKDIQAAIKLTNLGTGIAMAWMLSLGVYIFFFGESVLSFVTKDQSVIAAGTVIFKIAAMFQLFDAIAIVTTHALRGAGDTLIPTVIMFVANWLIFIAGGFLVVHYFPELRSTGPWLMATTMIIVTGIALRYRFHRGAWQRIEIFK